MFIFSLRMDHTTQTPYGPYPYSNSCWLFTFRFHATCSRIYQRMVACRRRANEARPLPSFRTLETRLASLLGSTSSQLTAPQRPYFGSTMNCITHNTHIYIYIHINVYANQKEYQQYPVNTIQLVFKKKNLKKTKKNNFKINQP